MATNQFDFKENEIVLYQPNDTIHLEVRMADETVWLTQAQLVELYQSSKANISEHIRHIFDEGELDENSTVLNFRTVQIACLSHEGLFLAPCIFLNYPP